MCSSSSMAQHHDIEWWPDDEWLHLDTPSDAGWSLAKLKEAREFSGSLATEAVMVIQRGLIVDAWGDIDRPFELRSMRKSVLSALFGPHIESGKTSLDQTLLELGIDDKNPTLNDDEKQATVADLLTSRSGVFHPANYEGPYWQERRPERNSHPHGTFWWYNNWDFNALGSILEQVAERGIFDEIANRIAAPIGMQDYNPAPRPAGHTWYAFDPENENPHSIHPGYDFLLSARDLARFGLLMARAGRWKGEQVIPNAWVAESTRSHCSATDMGGDYGFMWWVGDNSVLLPGVSLPSGSFSAFGVGSQALIVIPSWDLVIVHRVNMFQFDYRVSDAELGRLVGLILQASPTAR